MCRNTIPVAFYCIETMKGTEIMREKLKLYGFNNLTKSLSFNIFDICYAETQKEQKEYIEYLDNMYNSHRLINILTNLTQMIGAQILNISQQDYEPQGASVTMLIAEKTLASMRKTHVAHLDKSHVTVHTYPEYHPETCVATFRTDIDVSTCGKITPLSTLDYLIAEFDSDVITLDYRVRGFTRNLNGKKLFIDHEISSIQEYINEGTLKKYKVADMNMPEANLFHTKMMRKKIDLEDYVFNTNINEFSKKKKQDMENYLKKEMTEIFMGTTGC